MQESTKKNAIVVLRHDGAGNATALIVFTDNLPKPEELALSLADARTLLDRLAIPYTTHDS